MAANFDGHFIFGKDLIEMFKTFLFFPLFESYVLPFAGLNIKITCCKQFVVRFTKLSIIKGWGIYVLDIVNGIFPFSGIFRFRKLEVFKFG